MPTLADLLRMDLDPNFPVSTGNGKADDPLIITETRDYVGVEYAVVHHVLSMINEEYELVFQRILEIDGRMIDELLFKVKDSGASEWQGRRRYFFDVTAGYGYGIK